MRKLKNRAKAAVGLFVISLADMITIIACNKSDCGALSDYPAPQTMAFGFGVLLIGSIGVLLNGGDWKCTRDGYTAFIDSLFHGATEQAATAPLNSEVLTVNYGK